MSCGGCVVRCECCAGRFMAEMGQGKSVESSGGIVCGMS
jgi:hypothetical protein